MTTLNKICNVMFRARGGILSVSRNEADAQARMTAEKIDAIWNKHTKRVTREPALSAPVEVSEQKE